MPYILERLKPRKATYNEAMNWIRSGKSIIEVTVTPDEGTVMTAFNPSPSDESGDLMFYSIQVKNPEGDVTEQGEFPTLLQAKNFHWQQVEIVRQRCRNRKERQDREERERQDREEREARVLRLQRILLLLALASLAWGVLSSLA